MADKNSLFPKDYSPFTPGVSVPAELFIGRIGEIKRLGDKVGAAREGKLQVGFLTGERGIGKSSLASYVKYLADQQYQVLGIHTYLGGVSSLAEMVRRIFDRILKESVDKSWFGKIKQLFGSHIEEVDLFGLTLKFQTSEKELEHLTHDFAPALRRITDQLEHDKKGLFLILDDINGLSTSKVFADWLKSLIDEIATSSSPLPLFLLLVGLDERRHALIDQQPPLSRVFDLVTIEAWSEEETQTFYTDTFQKVGVQLDHEALQMMSSFAGGLPVLAHEIGDAVFKVDEDKFINQSDAFQGITNAAEIVGRKHLEPKVFQAIKSKRYRTILRKADLFSIHFQRSQVKQYLNEEENKVFDNFLKRMIDLGVIIREPEGRGAYRFSNLLHWAYFILEAEENKRKKD